MAGNDAFVKNMDILAYHDLDGKPWFQMAMQVVDGRYYLYGSHFKASGWAIVDVTDPAKPEYMKFVPGPELKGQTTPKIQVADGLMITALGGSLPMLHGAAIDDPYEEGIYIWDVKDPVNPKRLCHWQTGGLLGVHRFFYNGGRYVHLSASCKGFSGFIYRILDIVDPAHPVEVGRWWAPEQWAAGYIENRAADIESLLDGDMMHGPAYPKGKLSYVSYGGAGMMILDISDITLPKLVGQLRHHPPFAGKLCGARCHTVLPLSKRDYVVMTSEGERFHVYRSEQLKAAQPLNFIGMVDVSDPADPTLVSTFPYPEVPAGSPFKNFNETPGWGAGPFGPHNIHEPHDHPALEDRNDRVYCAYFHAGLRAYDISDAFIPKEIAYFIPPDPEEWAFNNEAGDLFPGPRLGTAEDVIVDHRGNIFVDTQHAGLYVLRCTV
ncbi:MAG: hypothetical protein A2133_03680 [Actinobacteria bacterium RBG_16_64_13]|nr:MAG: hypothetical protein A2133_03680 [Actinobacteria bacterium RBG_16_64_13]